MSLIQIPQAPTPLKLASQTEQAIAANLEQLANNLSGSIKECWQGDGYTPQEYVDSYGGKAARVFAFHGQLITLLKSFSDILPAVTQIDDSVLALVGNYTVNNDGTLIIS